MRRILFLLLITACSFIPVTYAVDTIAPLNERITNFNSKIVINPDASLTVTETIRVYAAGDQIKRGIYREFPTNYKDDKGLNYYTTFQVLEVLRDGADEDYHTEKKSNGVRLYIGNSEVYLRPGFYTYTITYRTTNQLGFFRDHDELYFNITGNGWTFDIDKVTADIQLPYGVDENNIQLEGFTGFQGEKASGYDAKIISVDGIHHVLYQTDTTLSASQGLTIVVGWPKGFIAEPTAADKLLGLIISNLAIFIGLVLLSAIFIYYFSIWLKYGRDPKGSGTVVTQYDIRKDISPAGARYIDRMAFDSKAITASLISMAIQTYIRIKEDKGIFSIEKTESEMSPYFDEEQVLYNSLFTGDTRNFTFKNTNSSIINSTGIKFNTSLSKNYLNKYFKNNFKFLIIPVVVSSLYLIIVILTASANVYTIPLFILMKIMHLISAGALKARTKQGREIQDQIIGLKNYLTAVEDPRYKSSINYELPDSLKVYEKYLPYAIALDVEPSWSSRFKEQIDQAQKYGTETSGLYSGSGIYRSSLLAGSLGNSLTSAITSSSVSPGSSSGFSGGGSSGGGGGGGGGGGW